MANNRRSWLQVVILCAVLVVNISGCAALKDYFDFSSTKKEEADLKESAKELANKGMDEYSVGKYFSALEHFQKILDRYPFTQEAVLAELKAADCKYFMENHQEALVMYKEFEERHPTNEAIPYVLYQKAMCSYLLIDRVDRDTTGATDSIAAFKQLLRAYPDSPFTAEAKARILAAQEFLANHEFFVAEFYMRAGKFNEAQTRLKYLLALYPESHMAPKAKELLGQIESGNTPSTSFTSYLPKVALPDWSIFKDKAAEEAPVKK